MGAGQLGRMLALAGAPLGIEFLMFDRSGDTPGAQVAPIMVGEFDDLPRLRRFARQVRPDHLRLGKRAGRLRRARCGA